MIRSVSADAYAVLHVNATDPAQHHAGKVSDIVTRSSAVCGL